MDSIGCIGDQRLGVLVKVVCDKIGCRGFLNRRLFSRGNVGLKLVRNSFGHLTLDRKDVRQFTIKGIGPKMGIVSCFDQLHIHAHRITAFLHATFQNVSHAKLPGNLRQIFRRAFVMLCGSTRDDFEISDLG